MYIVCSNCATKFTISLEQIGSVARKVKCSKCGNIWRHCMKEQIKPEPITSTLINNNTIELGKGINLPMLTEARIEEPEYPKFLGSLLAAFIICLSLLLFQENLGIKAEPSYSKLSIKDIKIHNLIDENKILVHYTIINSSNQQTSIPLARIKLFDKHNKLIKSSIVDNRKTNIPPNDYVSIQAKFMSEAKAEQVTITLGNILDLILR